MKIKTSKSKNTILFYIIKDYKKTAGDMDYQEWLKDYIRDFNEKQGHSYIHNCYLFYNLLY